MKTSVASPPQGQQESWTFVTGKRGRRKAAPESASAQPKPTQPQERRSYLSANRIKSDHERVQEQWQQSKSCRCLAELMSSRRSHPQVLKAICLGIGSFDPEDGSWMTKRRAHVQLAAFNTMVDGIPGNGEKIKCYFQEPCFTDGDKAFLSDLGYEAVDSPAGFELVSSGSMVFGVHLYRDIYSQAIGNCLPAIFVGTDYDTWESTLIDWPRMKELDQACDKAAFPEDDEFYPAFTSTSIHWRRTKEELKESGSKEPGSSP